MKYIILLSTLFLVACDGEDIVIPPDLCQCPDPIPEPGEPTPTPITPPPVITPTPPPTSSNPRCRGTMGTDGGGGFLWKPKSDPGGATPNKLVVLFPSNFVNKFEVVEVTRKNGRKENLVYTGKSNGERQTWRGSQEGSKYDGRVIAFDTDQECVWKVNSPGQRQD